MKRLIAFDVDSTLLRVESLDTAVEKALETHPDGAAARARLHEITDAGMTGRMALRESLESRLHLAELNRGSVAEIGTLLSGRLVPGMKPLLHTLREQGDELHAISGGFYDLLEPALAALGFGPAEIHTNRFVYEGDRVAGLDPDIPLSRNGGKADILTQLAHRAETTIMVGDGMTDFEAFEQGAADRFIGFGLVARRDVVIAACEYAGAEYVRDVTALAEALRR